MEVTTLIGETGLFQNVMLSIVMLRGALLAAQNLAHPFLFPDIDHWCAPQPGTAHKWGIQHWKKAAIPINKQSGRFERCVQYTHPIEYTPALRGDSERAIEPCTSWSYDHSEQNSSGTEKWNLVCDRAWMRSMPQFANMIGMLLGSIVIGFLSDRFGRRCVLLHCLLGCVVSELFMTLTNSFTVFVMLRSLAGFFFIGLNNVVTIYVETVGPGYRWRTMWGSGVTWGFGAAIPSLLALIAPWWNYQLLMIAGIHAALFLFWKYIRESPRWQITVGNYESGVANLKVIRRMNGLTPEGDPDDRIVDSVASIIRETAVHKKAQQPSVLTLLLSSTKAMKLAISLFCFQFLLGLCRYNMLLNTRTFQVSSYWNAGINAAVEIVCGFTVLFCVKFFLRKVTTITGCVAAVICLAVMTVRPASWTMSFMQLVTLFCLSVVSTVNIIYTVELSPTPLRALMFGVTTGAASAGALVQSFAEPLLNMQFFGPIVNCVLCVIMILCALWWPETKDRPLPDNIETSDGDVRSVSKRKAIQEVSKL